MTVLPYTLFLSGTVGVALCPEHADNASALLQCAESAVQQAKHEGLNLTRVYTHGAAISVRTDSIIARQIVKAMANNEFRLCYQPQIAAHDGRVTGMETLLRWHSCGAGHAGAGALHARGREARRDRADRRLGDQAGAAAGAHLARLGLRRLRDRHQRLHPAAAAAGFRRRPADERAPGRRSRPRWWCWKCARTRWRAT